MKRIKNPGAVFCALGFLAAAAALLAYPEEIKNGVRESLLYCLTVLTPSLFPFMALTGFAVNSGAGEILGKCLGLPVRYLFKLPEACAAPILMSFIGGYPAGARGASLLLEQGKITREQAGRMMLFCVNPGVAFVVTFLGGGILRSFRAGWILFCAVTLSGLALGVLSGLSQPVPEKAAPDKKACPEGAVIRSVTDTSRSVVSMCACVVLFSGFTAVIRGSGAYVFLCGALARISPFTRGQAAALLSFLIEVTGGVGDAAKFHVSAAFYAFGLAFGGLCVHLQVFSFFREFPVKKWKFFLFRFLNGLLAGGTTQLLLRLLPVRPGEALAVSGPVGAVSPLSGTLAGGLSLLLLCAAFLLIASEPEKR